MMPIIEERKPFRKEGQGDEYEFQAERSGKQSPFRKQPFCRRKSCGKSCQGDAGKSRGSGFGAHIRERSRKYRKR